MAISQGWVRGQHFLQMVETGVCISESLFSITVGEVEFGAYWRQRFNNNII